MFYNHNLIHCETKTPPFNILGRRSHQYSPPDLGIFAVSYKFLAWKPVTTYRGNLICSLDMRKELFSAIESTHHNYKQQEAVRSSARGPLIRLLARRQAGWSWVFSGHVQPRSPSQPTSLPLSSSFCGFLRQ